jgi:hypothetical protein
MSFLVVRASAIAAGRPCSLLPVLRILRPIAVANVPSAVIQAVAIAMIDNLPWLGAKDVSMHRNRSLTIGVIRPNGIPSWGESLLVGPGTPFVLVQTFKILVIDECELALREWYSPHAI